VLDHAEFAGASSARTATTPILDTIDHPQLFAPWFRKASTWSAWRVFLAALLGLPVGDGDLDLFRQCTGLGARPTPLGPQPANRSRRPVLSARRPKRIFRRFAMG